MVVATAIFTSCDAVLVAADRPKLLAMESLNHVQSDVILNDERSNRFLRVNGADNNDTDADDEERTVSQKFSKFFDSKIFSSSFLNIMKINKSFRLRVYKKWDGFTMERAVGEARLNNKRFAKMMVDYVQNYRIYQR